MCSPAMSNGQRHSPCSSETCKMAERGSEYSECEDFEILLLTQGKGARKCLKSLLFFFFLKVKKAPLLPQKRKAAHLWLLQAFPKKSAMKCWTAGLLGMSRTEGWEKKISRYWSRSCSCCYGRSFLGNKQVGSSVVPGQDEIAAAGTEMGMIGSSITACQTPCLPCTWKDQAMSAHVQQRLWLPSLYQMTDCFFRKPVCGFS